MGVYSPDMLAHFPEQFRDFSYFDMQEQVNSGYVIIGTPVLYSGILQNDSSMVADSSGNLVQIQHENLWFEGLLDRGKYVDFDSTRYRIVNGSDWPTEGGFYHYTLERLVGDNGTIDPTVWDIGGTPA
jgi:hypothetical protein